MIFARDCFLTLLFSKNKNLFWSIGFTIILGRVLVARMELAT
jgi:hypothetical protein